MNVDVLLAAPEVQATLLFGSQARGEAHATSDVDLALWLEPALTSQERFQVLRGLAARMPEADLVVLNDAPALLAHEIGRDGQLLFERGSGWRERLVQAARECWDNEPFRRTAWQVFRRAVTQPGGQMAPDPSLVAHVNHLRAAQRALHDLARRGREAVTSDEHLSASALHHLQLAAQSMIDLCARLAARRGLGSAQSYREAFQLLEREGTLPSTLSLQLQGWAGLRNVLVHLYLEVEWDSIWATLESELGDLDDFLKWGLAQPELA